MQESILSNDLGIFVCLCLAVFRVYVEVIDFKLSKLPLTKYFLKQKSSSFHQYGLYISVGYIVLFAPGLLIVSN